MPKATASNLQMAFKPVPLLEASALMYVAYTRYGRIATLAEEVREPRHTIPRAVIVTLLASMIVYGAVAVVAVGAAGADKLRIATIQEAAPLEVIARGFRWKIPALVAVGAMTAMLGVLLSLALGLSRVLLAMGRRGDMPQAMPNVSLAITATGFIVGALAMIGSVRTTWSFSAFTVLIYYAVTNLAALRLSSDERRPPETDFEHGVRRSATS